MSKTIRIRIAEGSLKTGESSIPRTADEFSKWVSRVRHDREGVDAIEVTVQFSDTHGIEDVITFLEGLAASEEWNAEVPELTTRVQLDEN